MSTILDSGATVDIFNNKQRFHAFRAAGQTEFIWAGESKVRVYGRGTVFLDLPTLRLRIPNAVYCPTFLCSVVSLRKLRLRGYHWDNKSEPTVLRRLNDSLVTELTDAHQQYVLEYNPLEEEDGGAAFLAEYNCMSRCTSENPEEHEKKVCLGPESETTRRPTRRRQTTRTPLRERRVQPAESATWHLRMGHPNPEALRRIINATDGVRIRGPSTVECDQCGTAKAKRVPNRSEPYRKGEEKGERFAIDFHDFEMGYKGSTSMALIINR